LTLNLDRVIDPMECVLTQGAILADPLDVQKTSVGLEAEPPQGGQVKQVVRGQDHRREIRDS
jgi:hypothetical protein